MTALRVAKKELRRHLKAALKDVSNESVTIQSTCIVESLLSLPEYQNARRISVYLSMPSGEVHTAAIVRDALSSGKKVFIPYFYKLSSPQPGHLASAMDMLELDSLQDYDGLEADKWGIPTPTEESISRRNNCFGGRGKSEGEVVFREAREHGLDLVITPGLGFDGELRRIGRGMGFYDSFFARCGTYSSLTGSRIPWTVGLALNEQMLPRGHAIPMEETDQELDGLIMGNGIELRRVVD